jgi:uncharacterized DUF497 family protein
MKKSNKLLWDSVNRRKIVQHNLTVEEVEEALADRRRVDNRTRTGDSGQNKDIKRFKMVGKTYAGDFITVILGITSNGLPRVVTAYPSPQKDVRLYKRRR